MSKIIKILSVPQPGNSQYYWIYGLGEDNKMYVWHEKKADWILHAKNNEQQNQKPNMGYYPQQD